MAVEREVQEVLRQFGVYDVLVPFAIAFAITWGVLERTQVLGYEDDGKTPKHRLNISLAVVIGLICVVAWGKSTVFNTTMQIFVYMTLTFFALFFISGIFFGSEWREHKSVKITAGIIGALVVALAFRLYDYLRGAEALIAAFFGLSAFVWAVAYVVRGEKAGKTHEKKETKKKGNLMSTYNDLQKRQEELQRAYAAASPEERRQLDLEEARKIQEKEELYRRHKAAEEDDD